MKNYDYEKLYKEAIERAKEFMTNKGVALNADAFRTAKELTETIFPELKESEDEKIRKVQLDYWRSNGSKEWQGVPVQEIIAWLEKQGDQKPIDKAELKFKVGDWIVNDRGEIARIVEIRRDFYGILKYYMECKDDNKIAKRPCIIDNKFRLWTIQDAKDGTVLVNGSNIFIFSHLSKTRAMGYCHINLDDVRFYYDKGKNECFGLIDAVFTPATEEQRKLLFQKMKEAGYEWDAEKKELKKTEYNTVEWREDDEKISKAIYESIDFLCLEHFDVSEDTLCDWLKSLKDRVQPQTKQEWSEEDKSMYIRTLGILGKCYMGELPIKVEEELEWLKSIEPNNWNWKPSEEQMAVLKNAIHFYGKTVGKEVLESLYNDLKNL